MRRSMMARVRLPGAILLLILLSACAPAPTATPRPRPTPTVSCEESRRAYCEGLEALQAEMLLEIMPLCSTKPNGWCAEQIVGLGKRAATLEPPSCALDTRTAARRAFATWAFAPGPGLSSSEREELISSGMAAWEEAMEVCR